MLMQRSVSRRLPGKTSDRVSKTRYRRRLTAECRKLIAKNAKRQQFDHQRQ